MKVVDNGFLSIQEIHDQVWIILRSFAGFIYFKARILPQKLSFKAYSTPDFIAKESDEVKQLIEDLHFGNPLAHCVKVAVFL